MIKLNPTSNPKNLIQTLSKDESFIVLQKLFRENPDLEKVICETALKVVSNVDAEKISNNLYNDLLSLDVDELYARSGNGRYGYVDPNEESWVMFEEVVEFYIGEMEKHHQRKLPHIVKEYCIGIINGLIKFSEEANTEFSEWVEDAPLDHIDYVIDCYEKTKPEAKDLDQIMSNVEEL